MSNASLIWLVPLFPLLGVLLNGLVFTGQPRATQRRVSGWIASAMVFASFIVALFVASGVNPSLPANQYPDVKLFDWITVGAVNIPMALRVDPLSVTMMLVITGVGTLIHIFSVGYMADDERVGRYFTYLNLFTFAMLILVLANNFVLMFVGWEGVGLCSYLLIGFWFERVSAAQAGKKAFLVNRVGDFGFLLGMFALFWFTGTFTYYTPDNKGALDMAQNPIFHQLTLWGWPAATVICLLLFVGATGKSAQLPLYVWLPDAMEGPTPVSALIHAATMVTAGVYMVARSAPLFGQSAEASAVVAWVGAITALYAAIIAIKQYDIKRVLAYSTVSQLGYMFIGVGVGAYAAGISHLITHAFFKALMFLGAGAVMHALEGQLDLRKMGNLKGYLRVTFGTFFVGWLAICGIPPFAGFFSKDYVLESAKHHGFEGIFWIGIVTAGLTAFYMTRMFITVFFGSERIEMGEEGHGGDAQEHGKHHQHGVSEQHRHEHDHTAHGHGHAHDHGHGHGHGHAHVHPELPVCNWPLIILAIASALGGILIVPKLYDFIKTVTYDVVPHFAGHEAGEHGGAFDLGAALGAWETYLSIGVGVAGIAVAWAVFGPEKLARGWSSAAERAFGFLQNVYEGILHAIVVVGGTRLSELLYSVIDRGVIDRIVEGTGSATAGLAESLRTLQTGYVRNYALVMLAGSVFVVACFMLILQQWPWLNWRSVLPILITVVVVGLIASFITGRREAAEAETATPAEGSH